MKKPWLSNEDMTCRRHYLAYVYKLQDDDYVDPPFCRWYVHTLAKSIRHFASQDLPSRVVAMKIKSDRSSTESSTSVSSLLDARNQLLAADTVPRTTVQIRIDGCSSKGARTSLVSPLRGLEINQSVGEWLLRLPC